MATGTAAAGPYEPGVLPPGVQSRFVERVNGLRMHVLEAGFEQGARPTVLLLHGFPELAYSWRKVMPALADAGYHAIAPDLRGYGRTSGRATSYDDLAPFYVLNEVRDMLCLLAALGCRLVAGVVGHDFGSPIAAWCALARPDVFRSVVLMSAPFAGPPALPGAGGEDAERIFEELKALDPPRMHYRKYYSTRAAEAEMMNAPGGVHAFLRAYYHMKSADWAPNKPHPLEARTATEWAKLPRYYVMELGKDMARTVAPHMPSAAEIEACRWLTDAELGLYSAEYSRTGFQGGLQWYRVESEPGSVSQLQIFSGRTLDQPSMFIGGKSDWGVYQAPGALERMRSAVCTDFRGVHLVDGAGHWVQQEQPGAVNELLLDFLARASRGRAQFA